MKTEVLSDLILTTFLQSMPSQDDKDSMKIPLMISVDPMWVELMKEINVNTGSELGDLIESSLMVIFGIGCNACISEIRQRYEKPSDIVTSLFGENDA